MGVDDAIDVTESAPGHSLGPLAAAARQYADEARAPSTRRAYQGSWGLWERWCTEHGLCALPAAPESVALYLAHLADLRRAVATIERILVAISQAHRMASHPSPRQSEVVRSVLKGIRRRQGVVQRQKAPLVPEQLRAISQALPTGLLGLRDRALLLVGFASALRRAELAAIDLRDVAFTDDGVVVEVRRSKTDQEGRGRRVGIPYGSVLATCPVRSLRAWVEAARLENGPVFRAIDRHGHVSDRALHPASIAKVVKRAAASAGLAPGAFAGHSLRAGFATAAARAGKSERSIMAQTGHRSLPMVRRYIRDGSLFAENAAAGIGL